MEFNVWLIELISPLVTHIVAIMDIMVRIRAVMPIFFDFPSFCFKYFHACQSPNGGKNKLMKYIVICLDNDTEGCLSLCGFPQLGHAKASLDISCPHSLHFVNAIFLLYSLVYKFLRRKLIPILVYVLLNMQDCFGSADYILAELYAVYPMVKISMEKLSKLSFIKN